MKKSVLLTIIFSCVTLILPSKENETKKSSEIEYNPIVEKVTVTNVEVPVRVLYKNKSITNLTKNDFTLYEDKKKVEINGFFLKRKKIKFSGLIEKNKRIQAENTAPPRTFVLVFSITDFNENLKSAVEHLFNTIFRPNDRLLIFANEKTIRYPDLKDKDNLKAKLLNELKEESYKTRRRLIKYINTVETYLNMHDFRIQFHQRQDLRPQRLISFLKKYIQTWNDYKKKYLTPPIERFYYFSRYLENIKTEKWVLNFYQFDLFPRINMRSNTMDKIRELSAQLTNSNEAGAHSMGRLINTLLNQILVDLDITRGFPTEDISKLFYKVDATFHSFFIRNMERISLSDLEYEEVSSNIERTLKEITDITGGQNITSNDLVNSIETVSEIEDTYYILTYVPHNPEKAGKLKITVKEKKYKVLYDDNFRADYINEYIQRLEEKIEVPEIKIEDFSFQGKVLAFKVKDYMMKNMGSNVVGRMTVRIRLTKDRTMLMLYDQEKLLTAQKDVMKISLGNFKKIGVGEYHFLIDAVDLLTGKEANVHKNIIVKR